ncbi:ArsR/SmtB family transcription factor [Thermococcus sp.]
MKFETIHASDEKAKELAQILLNDKALAILQILQDEELSISEIASRLNMPISTVSYHIDKMTKVGLVEISGKKYGKRLQEVKLYRASPTPILLLPGKPQAKKKFLRRFEQIQIISLTIAGLLAIGVYKIVGNVVKPVTPHTKVVETFTNTSTSRMFIKATTTATANTTTTATYRGTGVFLHSYLPYIAAFSTFVLVFLLLTYYFKKRNL